MPDFAVKTAFTAADGLSPALRRMQSGVSAVSSRMSAMSGSFATITNLAKMMLPVFGGFAIANIFQTAMEKAKSYETSLANVRAGLQSTKGAAGLTETQLVEMSKKLSSESMFGGGAILQNASAQLLTFSGVTSANFERIQKAAADVTAKLKGINSTGEDLHGVSIMMGKAMDDPVRGMTAMRKAGLLFSDEQENMIKKLAKSGDKVSAQKYMLEEIERLYGGTAKALMQTEQGQEMLVQKKIDGLLVNIGKALLPVKRDFLELALTILPAIAKGFSVLINFIRDNQTAIKLLVGGFIAFKFAVIAARTIISISGWISFIKMMGGFRLAVIKATISQWALNAALLFNPFTLLVVGIMALIAAGVALYAYWEPISKFFIELWDGVVSGFNAAIDWIIQKFTAVVDWVSKKWQSVKAFFGFAAESGQQADASMSAPNETEAAGKYGNNTTVNINSNGTQATADVTPKHGAVVNMQYAGLNP